MISNGLMGWEELMELLLGWEELLELLLGLEELLLGWDDVTKVLGCS